MNILVCIFAVIIFQVQLVACDKPSQKNCCSRVCSRLNIQSIRNVFSRKPKDKRAPVEQPVPLLLPVAHKTSADEYQPENADIVITMQPLLEQPLAAVSPEEQEAVFKKLEHASATELLALVAEYSFLRAPRVNHNYSVIERCVRDGWYPNHTEQVQALLDVGVPIDQKNYAGETTLLNFSRMSGFEIIQALLDHKADPTCADDYGHTSLGRALSSDRGQESAYALSAHPNIASLINTPMIIGSGIPQKWVIPLISRAYTAYYKEEIMKNFLRAGYQITAQDVYDAAYYCWKPFLQRCPLRLLVAVRSLAPHPQAEESVHCKWVSSVKAIDAASKYIKEKMACKELLDTMFSYDVSKLIRGYSKPLHIYHLYKRLKAPRACQYLHKGAP